MMDTWISIEDEMPEEGSINLVFYKNKLGKNRIVKATFIYRYTIESNGEYGDYFNDEYYEEEDIYYIKEDWYECLDNWEEYSSIVISEGVVTHWMPLPNPPE